MKTNKECHRILWDNIVELGYIVKGTVIDKMIDAGYCDDIPDHYCFACEEFKDCDVCPIAKNCKPCTKDDSDYNKVKNYDDKEAAKRIRDAWK